MKMLCMSDDEGRQFFFNPDAVAFVIAEPDGYFRLHLVSGKEQRIHQSQDGVVEMLAELGIGSQQDGSRHDIKVFE
jgi:hypothetical protein